jgi:hypothetical protein
MNYRDRYAETVLFGNPDKVPFMPGYPRESTLRRWHSEGLPEGANWLEAVAGEIGISGIDGYYSNPGFDFRMYPLFEEKVLEHGEGYLIVQDWMGATVQISDQFDPTYLRVPRDFVTRKWIKCPVTNHEDWEKMREKYDAAAEFRVPADSVEKCLEIRNGGNGIGVSLNGPFWQLREWCGFEGLCELFMDEPDFVKEMIEYWLNYTSTIIDRISAVTVIDKLFISEDMAYKEHSMLSPAMTREFLQPSYIHWVNQVKKAGCRVIDMDSDGYIGELIPIWIESGINVCDPIEVAAGNDINKFRKEFGRKIGYTGGVDKRAMAAGGRILQAELDRIAPVVEDGGYIPSCDHGVPSDISWKNFIDYSDKLAHICGWK